jgi:hypothetical protein
MHANGGQTPGIGKTARETGANQQGADQARASRIGNSVDMVPIHGRIPHNLVDLASKSPNMVPRGQLRHHPAIGTVHGDLAPQLVGQESSDRVVKGDTRFITRGFDAKYTQVRNASIDPNDRSQKPRFAFSRGAL